MTVVLNWLITLHILLTWHHLTNLCFPTWKNPKIFGWEAVSDRWWGHICSWGHFRRTRMRAFIPQESKRCNTDGRSLCRLQGRLHVRMLKNKPHLVKFDHCIIVSLWIFASCMDSRLYSRPFGDPSEHHYKHQS